MSERFRGRISEGMTVRSADGEKLGKVVTCQASGFVVEKGFLFPKDQLVPYERVTSVGNGEVVLSMTQADAADLGGAREATATARTAMGSVAEEVKGAAKNLKEAVTGAVGAARAAVGGDESKKGAALDQFGTAGEICVPLVEEEIVTSKRVEKVGEVHIRKQIITEEKQITVPVTREVIRVERVSVTHEVRADDKPFEEEAYDIPIREEHVTIEKRPVVHEELHVAKEILQGEETASTAVRRERAEVETLGSIRRAEARKEGPGGDQGQPRQAGPSALAR